MTAQAVRLACSEVGAVQSLIGFIVGLRAVGEIVSVVVQSIAVQMAHFLSDLPRSEKRRSHQGMNSPGLRFPICTQGKAQVARQSGWLEDTRASAYIPEIAHLVEVLIARHGQPLFVHHWARLCPQTGVVWH